MPEFRGDAVRTPEQHTVEQQGGADPGADGDQHGRPDTRGGTEPVLGPRGGVGVVLENHRQADPRAHPLRYGHIRPREVRGVADDATVGGEEPGDGEADGGDLVAARQEGDGAVEGAVEGTGRVRGRRPHGVDDGAGTVDDGRADAGAAHVDSDRESIRAHGVGPISVGS